MDTEQNVKARRIRRSLDLDFEEFYENHQNGVE
jgi:hypothetical protein